MSGNCRADGAWREVGASISTFVALCLSLFFSPGSFVSNGGHSGDRRERQNKPSRLISAPSRVLFSSAAQDLNLVLEAGAAKTGLLCRLWGFSHHLLHRCVCAGWLLHASTFLFCCWNLHIRRREAFFPSLTADYHFILSGLLLPFPMKNSHFILSFLFFWTLYYAPIYKHQVIVIPEHSDFWHYTNRQPHFQSADPSQKEHLSHGGYISGLGCSQTRHITDQEPK